MLKSSRKPILCLDFDGVIHTYDRGWQSGEIYGEVTPGFWDWAVTAQEHFKLVIYSSRSKTEEGIKAMVSWLQTKHNNWREETALYTNEDAPIIDFEFAHEKPPAFLTIDDRAIQFQGKWDIPELDPESLTKFKPWNTDLPQPQPIFPPNK